MEREHRMLWLCGVLAVAAFAYFHLAFPAKAHDVWANAAPVPAWVQSSCCGPDDVHHLEKWQVEAKPDGWHVDGYKQIVAYGRELPSQDGEYWIFYKNFPDGTQTPVYCFFAPIQSF